MRSNVLKLHTEYCCIFSGSGRPTW